MSKEEALAKYLNCDVADIEETSYGSYETPEGEFNVYTDDEADEEFESYETALFDDLGLDSFTSTFQDWIMSNALNDDFFNEILDEEIEYFTNDEPDPDMVSYVESFRDNPAGYIVDAMGQDELNRIVKEHPVDALDIDAIIEEAKSLDGRGPSLAGYDGDEIELDGNYYAYRIS